MLNKYLSSIIILKSFYTLDDIVRIELSLENEETHLIEINKEEIKTYSEIVEKVSKQMNNICNDIDEISIRLKDNIYIYMNAINT